MTKSHPINRQFARKCCHSKLLAIVSETEYGVSKCTGWPKK